MCDAVPGGAHARRMRPRASSWSRSFPRLRRAPRRRNRACSSSASPEGTVLHYKSFNQLDQNFGGTDVSMNQTSQVDMAYGSAPDSTGAARVDLKYIEVKSSLLSGGQLRDWSPPIKLEGATIRIMVMSNGDIVKFDPGRGVPGLEDVEDLRDIVDAWFVKFPETEIAGGTILDRGDRKGNTRRRSPGREGSAGLHAQEDREEGRHRSRRDRGQDEDRAKLRDARRNARRRRRNKHKGAGGRGRLHRRAQAERRYQRGRRLEGSPDR